VNKSFVFTRAFVSDLILLCYRATTRAVNAALAAMEPGHATKMAAMVGLAAVPESTLDVLVPKIWIVCGHCMAASWAREGHSFKVPFALNQLRPGT
jgi:hypothetical protein